MPLVHILEKAICLPKLIIHLSLVLGERGLVMLLWIGLGSFLGVLFWQTGMAGLFFGALFGWLGWKVSSLSALVEKLRLELKHDNSVGSPPQKSRQIGVGAVAFDKKTVPASFEETEAEPHAAPAMAAGNKKKPMAAQASRPSYSSKQQEPQDDAGLQGIVWADDTDWGTKGLEKMKAMLIWFVSGNTLVRVGSIILFFGAGFLLKYAAEHSHISIEVRMLGIVLLACTMIGFGWYLRASRMVYALALQGGGVGLLYLTIFASYRLYAILPPLLALTLLALVSAAGVALSVIHNARWLAILSFLGGFLAPMLASTGTGSHVGLFSWYAVLNVGIAILAWHKAWRSLNLLGMIATFIIAALWGSQYYNEQYFDSVEPFLIGFGLMYLAVGVLFSLHKADPEQEGFGRVDGSIIFGTPVGFFLLQTPLVHHFEHGMSLSALLSGLVYLAAAWFAYCSENRVLMIALLSIAATLLTLAIPLEFDEAETAAAWAMEGVGLLWLGLKQKSQRAVATGLILQVLAAGCWIFGSPIQASASYGSSLSALLIGLAGWACVLVLTRQTEESEEMQSSANAIVWEKSFPVLADFLPTDLIYKFQLWGLLWWLVAGFTELHRHWHDHDLLLAAIGWITLTAWLLDVLRIKLSWNRLYQLNTLLVFVWLGGLLIQSFYVSHPTQDWALLAWAPAFLTTYILFYRDDQRQVLEEHGASDPLMKSIPHVIGFCFVLSFLIWESHWQATEWLVHPNQMPIWADLVPAVITSLLVILVCRGDDGWPMCKHRTSYLSISAGISMLVLGGWFIKMLDNPVDSYLPYVPLFNMLDLVIALAGLAVYSWWEALEKYDLLWFEKREFYTAIGAILFIVFNMDIARTVHYWFEVPWTINAMIHANVLQTALSISWSALALLLMSWASKRNLRLFWIVGAVLLAVVVVKLFAIDMSGSGTLARIVSFLGVGGLLLLIGYMSPLPPEASEAEIE